MDFKVGDKVIATKDSLRIQVGDKGVAVHIKINNTGVCWERRIGGHDCNGYAKVGHGWYVKETNIKLAEPEIKFKLVKKRKNK